jgi:putative ABC transport system permease protein
MVGLALVSAFSILGSLRQRVGVRAVDTAVRADYVVSTAVGQPFTPEVAERLRAVDGVQAVSQERFGQALIGGTETLLAAVDPATLDRTLALDYTAGGSKGLAGRGLLVDAPTAKLRGWEVGDTVSMVSATGQSAELTLGGVFAANQAVGAAVVSLDTWAASGGVALDRYVYVDVSGGADTASVRASLEAALDPYPVVTLKDRDEFAGEQKGQVDQILLLINALLVLSVLIAVLGIVNTLPCRSSSGPARSVCSAPSGMTRGQLRRMVRLESVLISVYGSALGLGSAPCWGPA